MRPLVLILLALAPAALAADTLQLTLCALTAKDAVRIPPEVASDPAKLAAFLDKLKSSKRALVPLETAEPFTWRQTISAEHGEPYKYFQKFTEADGKIVGASEATRTLGYRYEFTGSKEGDDRARFKFTFEWTPTVAEVPIAESRPTAILPTFHTVKATGTPLLTRGTPTLVATWMAAFPLSRSDKGGDRQLYLLATWTDQPADQ